MLWAYVAAAVALTSVVALWLARRAYRRADDTVHLEISPWWLPLLAGLGVLVGGVLNSQWPPVVAGTYLLALVWALTLALIDIEVARLPDALVLPLVCISRQMFIDAVEYGYMSHSSIF